MSNETIVEVLKQLITVCEHQQNVLESMLGTKLFVSEPDESYKARQLLDKIDKNQIEYCK